jgi:O-antigen/teichoic acid export membrane protein
MSRLRRFKASVVSGYAVIAVNVAYTLITVPIALHYLTQEEFGVWALMVQVSGYLALLDLGMSSSVARLLIDHKDDSSGGVYGSLVSTGWVVLIVQGLLILIATFPLMPLLAVGLNLPSHLQPVFVRLMRWQMVFLLILFATKMLSHLLYAHQRFDLINYAQIGQSICSLAVLWLCFRLEQGVSSVVWSQAAGIASSGLLGLIACSTLGLFPRKGAWGRPSWRRFRELFAYSRDIFLVALGGQFIVASQVIIVTRGLGVDAAAIWSICIRTFGLLNQLIWRFFDSSGPAFSEMMVRGERQRLFHRYKMMCIASFALSGVAAVLFSLTNQPFVEVWTRGKVQWPVSHDILLGIWMVLLAMVHCHDGLILLTKEVGAMRYVFFIEGVVFFLAASLAVKLGGFPAILACSILCSLLFSGSYGIWRISRLFGLSWREVAFKWQLPLLKVLLFFVPIAILIWRLSDGLPPASRFAANLIVGGTVGAVLSLRYAFCSDLQRELLDHAPGFARSLLRRILVRT